MPQAFLAPLSPVHVILTSLLSALCSNYPIPVQMACDVMRVTDNSLKNPEEILGRLGKKPLSDILRFVFSLVSPFRKYSFNTSLVLPLSRLHFAKAPVITPGPPPALCWPRPWENASAAFRVCGQQCVRVPSCITNVFLYLHAAFPSVLYVPSSLDPLRLFQILVPCINGHCSCPEFPSKGIAMKCSFPD